MFTGIIELTGTVQEVKAEGTNRIFRIRAPFTEPIRVDQSIAHSGVCLTVTEIFSQGSEAGAEYSVTAVDETLKKSNLGTVGPGDLLNIERCMQVGARLDGHFVQGHVDAVGTVESVEEVGGSWMYAFRFDKDFSHLLVNKGSVSINGVSLTVVDTKDDRFNVTIIPFTYEHTNFGKLKAGDQVNLEFDILGKYIHKIMEGRMHG
jgi:riboflavin synthase